VHELSHVWDYWHGFAISKEMNSLTKSHKYVCKPKIYICFWVYDKEGQNEKPPTIYARPDPRSNPREDWSDSVSKYVYPDYKKYEGSLGEIRKSFIVRIIRELPISPKVFVVL
jgi:hypothetical protein